MPEPVTERPYSLDKQEFETQAARWIGAIVAGEPLEIDLRGYRFVSTYALFWSLILARQAAGRGPSACRVLLPDQENPLAAAHRWGAIGHLERGDLELIGKRRPDTEWERADPLTTRVLPLLAVASAEETASLREEFSDPERVRAWLGHQTELAVVASGDLTHTILLELAQNIAGHAYVPGTEAHRRFGLVCGQVHLGWQQQSANLAKAREGTDRPARSAEELFQRDAPWMAEPERRWHESRGLAGFLEVLVGDHGRGFRASLEAQGFRPPASTALLLRGLLDRSSAAWFDDRDRKPDRRGLRVIYEVVVQEYGGCVALREGAHEIWLAAAAHEPAGVAFSARNLTAELPGAGVRILLPLRTAHPRQLDLPLLRGAAPRPGGAPPPGAAPYHVRFIDLAGETRGADALDPGARVGVIAAAVGRAVPAESDGGPILFDFADVDWNRNEVAAFMDALRHAMPRMLSLGTVPVGVHVHPNLQRHVEETDAARALAREYGAWLWLDDRRQSQLYFVGGSGPAGKRLRRLIRDGGPTRSATLFEDLAPDQADSIRLALDRSGLFRRGPDDTWIATVSEATLESLLRTAFSQRFLAWARGAGVWLAEEDSDHCYVTPTGKRVAELFCAVRILESPEWARRVTTELAQRLRGQGWAPDHLVSLTSPGIRLAHHLAHRLNLAPPEGRRRIGVSSVPDVVSRHTILHRARIVIVTDVVHTADNVTRTREAVEAAGGEVLGAVAVVDARPDDGAAIPCVMEALVRHPITVRNERHPRKTDVQLNPATNEPLAAGAGEHPLAWAEGVLRPSPVARFGVRDFVAHVEPAGTLPHQSGALFWQHVAGDHHHQFQVDVSRLLSSHRETLCEAIEGFLPRDASPLVCVPDEEEAQRLLEALDRRRRERRERPLERVGLSSWRRGPIPTTHLHAPTRSLDGRHVVLLQLRAYSGRTAFELLDSVTQDAEGRPASLTLLVLVSQLEGVHATHLARLTHYRDVPLRFRTIYEVRVPAWSPAECPTCRVRRDIERVTSSVQLPDLWRFQDEYERILAEPDTDTLALSDAAPPATVAGRALMEQHALHAAVENPTTPPFRVIDAHMQRLVAERSPGVIRYHLASVFRVFSSTLASDSAVTRTIEDFVPRLAAAIDSPELARAVAMAALELPDLLLQPALVALYGPLCRFLHDEFVFGAMHYLHRRLQRADGALPPAILETLAAVETAAREWPDPARSVLERFRGLLLYRQDGIPPAMKRLQRLLRGIGRLGHDHGDLSRDSQQGVEQVCDADAGSKPAEELTAGVAQISRVAEEVLECWELASRILALGGTDPYLFETGPGTLRGDTRVLTQLSRELARRPPRPDQFRQAQDAAQRVRDALATDGTFWQFLDRYVQRFEKGFELEAFRAVPVMHIGDVPPPESIAMDRPADRIFRDLVANAQHPQKGVRLTRVEVDARDADRVLVRLCDEGAGVPPERLSVGSLGKLRAALVAFGGDLRAAAPAHGENAHVEVALWKLR